MKKAIIDLGTNTCNLLIAEVNANECELLHSSKVAVKLGKGGINNNQLTKEATQRAIHALLTHLDSMKPFGKMDDIRVIATSAVRDAVNKAEFAQQLKDATGLDLTIISGDEEASYIFEGVKFALGEIPDNALIMDIGGGSNEFILVKNNQVAWKRSFPTGIARVVERFDISDPIQSQECEAIKDWFEKMMPELQELPAHEISTLIGCSGTFDTVADEMEGIAPNSKIRKALPISIADFKRVFQKLYGSTDAERRLMPSIEVMRVEMIVPALLLIDFIIQKFNISLIIQTDYSLKEGALQSIAN
ncbi:MAG: phosphatase [Mangrovibacterium sp.]